MWATEKKEMQNAIHVSRFSSFFLFIRGGKLVLYLQRQCLQGMDRLWCVTRDFVYPELDFC